MLFDGATAYGSSKAAVHRFSELLAQQLLPQNVFVFSISPGLVRTAMTDGRAPEDAPWSPPDCAPRLVRALAFVVVPVVAHFFVGEPLAWNHLVGGLVIAAGIWIAQSA